MSEAAKRKILQLEREQARSINAGDVDGAVKMFDRQFVGFSSTRHARIRGLTPLARTFRHYLDLSPRMSYRIGQPVVQVRGDLAVATFYWTVGLKGGRRVRGRGTHVFIRRGRDWRVIHEHFSRAH